MISLNVELLKSAVVSVVTSRPALMHIWVETGKETYKSVLILTEQISAVCVSIMVLLSQSESDGNQDGDLLYY